MEWQALDTQQLRSTGDDAMLAGLTVLWSGTALSAPSHMRILWSYYGCFLRWHLPDSLPLCHCHSVDQYCRVRLNVLLTPAAGMLSERIKRH